MPDAKEMLIYIDEKDMNSGRVMEKTPEFMLVPKMLISVPNNYFAAVISDGTEIKRLRSCQKKNLVKSVGKDLLGKKISVLYVNRRRLTAMSWGIGGLPVKYDRIGGYVMHVGASGTLLPEIVGAADFYASFMKTEGTLSLTETVSRITYAFRTCASKILVEMFSEAVEPIFDTEFMVSEFDRRINKHICNRALGVIPGVVFRSSTVTGIRVREEDKISVLERFGTGDQSVRR